MQAEARHAVRKTVPWLRAFTRFGYAAHGVVYLAVGALAVMVATGNGDGVKLGKKGALHELHDKPFGQVLLAIVAAGLLAYAAWKGVRAILDPEHEASGLKGVVKRIGWAFGAIVHGALVVYALGLIDGRMSGGTEIGRPKSWSARIMAWEPAGPWLVGALGAIFLGVAIWQIRCAIIAKLDDQLDLGSLRSATRRIVVDVSRVGIAARGVVYGLVGLGLVVAAFRADPHHVQDASEALDRLRHVAYGEVLLLVIAVGLMAYGVYGLIEARYRRIG